MVSHMQRILLPAGTNSCISISLILQMASLFFLLKKIKFVACLQFSGREVQRSRAKVHRICLSASTEKREMIHLMYRLPLHVSFQIQPIAILDEIFLCNLMLYVMKCSIKLYLCDEMLISCWYILGWTKMIVLFIWAV